MTSSQLSPRLRGVPSSRFETQNEGEAEACADVAETLTTILLGTLGRLGFGIIVVGQNGSVNDLNDIARDLLERHIGVNKTQRDDLWLRESVRRLLERATPYLPPDTEAWVTIPCDTDRPLALHRMSLGRENNAARGYVLVLVDLDRSSPPSHATLNRLFGLTAAEARLAIWVSRGGTAVGMANDNRLSVATIRSQLGSIFQKTNTNRQSELALLLARVAMLP